MKAKNLPPIIWHVVGVLYVMAVSPFAWVLTDGTVFDTISELRRILTTWRPI